MENKWKIIMGCTLTLLLISFIRISIRESVLYVYHDVRVTRTAEFEYWMEPTAGPRFHTTICRDYLAPEFSTGMVLETVIFADKGSCWSLNPNEHAGYFILRGNDGRPIYKYE